MNDELRSRSVGAPAARSVLLTVLGEYVRPRGGQGAWLGTLISALGALGYKTGAARQAMARSIADRWLLTERRGRRSRVTLSEGTREMLTSGAERIYGFGADYDWDGHWLLVVLRVPEEHRDLRHQVRTELAWAGFGSLGNGLWISPHVDRETEIASLSDGGSVAELMSFHAEAGQLGMPDGIVHDAWDLEALGEAYMGFIGHFAKLRPKAPEAVFAAQTSLVHAWRKFPFLDPDLPRELLPANWPRDRALDVFRQRHGLWHDTAQDYFGSLEAINDAA